MIISKKQIEKLYSTGRVSDVEDEGMDEGRFFVHLKDEYNYPHPYSKQHTKSFGGFREALCMVNRAVLVN